MLDRFEDGERAALVVQRAATPDGAVADGARERRLDPVALRACLDRNDVEMCQQHDRLAFAAAAPREQQAVIVDDLACQRAMDAREALFEKLAQAAELAGIELRRILIRDGPESHRLRQSRRGLVGIDLDRRRRLDLDLPRGRTHAAHDQHGSERQQGDPDEEGEFFHPPGLNRKDSKTQRTDCGPVVLSNRLCGAGRATAGRRGAPAGRGGRPVAGRRRGARSVRWRCRRPRRASRRRRRRCSARHSGSPTVAPRQTRCAQLRFLLSRRTA